MSNHCKRVNKAHRAGKWIIRGKRDGYQLRGHGDRYMVRKPIAHPGWLSSGFVVRHPDMQPLIHNGRKP